MPRSIPKTEITTFLICCMHTESQHKHQSTYERPTATYQGSSELSNKPLSGGPGQLWIWTTVWKIVKEHIQSSQKHQKATYDCQAKTPAYIVGDHVMVHMPYEATGKSAKLARPYFGPYRIISLTPSNVEVCLVDKPDDPHHFHLTEPSSTLLHWVKWYLQFCARSVCCAWKKMITNWMVTSGSDELTGGSTLYLSIGGI